MTDPTFQPGGFTVVSDTDRAAFTRALFRVPTNYRFVGEYLGVPIFETDEIVPHVTHPGPGDD